MLTVTVIPAGLVIIHPMAGVLIFPSIDSWEGMIMTDIWAMLEQDAPEGCGSVQDLYSWSLNYDAGKGPFALFLDLIGYSMEEYGERFYDMDSMSLGYVELSKLAAALTSYSVRPRGVTEYVSALMAAEGEQ